jgi:acetate CoA/acetoacetate CoA-transferase alpha subunit
MKSLLSFADAVRDVPNGATIMIGGFMCCGQPLGLIDALIAKDIKDLTVICNDAGLPDQGVAKLIVQGRVRHLIASHIGLNPVAGQKMNSGEMKVDLVPQGTLAERIRCAGTGLGGFLTPTGIGTEVEKGKQKLTVNGREYLLETPLAADFAFIKGGICDRTGNTFLPKATKNFNIVMAMAARETIVEADRVVELGQLDADQVTVPGVFVHRITQG